MTKLPAPYYVLLLRAANAKGYTNEAGSSNKADLVAKASRALMRGMASAMVVKVEWWQSATSTQTGNK